MREDAIPHTLMGGGMRSTRPTLLQMWVIQWGPGTSLAGWVIAALAIEGAGTGNSSAAFILAGMFFGVALWTLVAVFSIPLFFLMKPWIEHLPRTAPRLRGAVLAAAGALPFVLIAILYWLALPLEKSAETRSTVGQYAVLTLGVTFGLGAVAATEMWSLFFQCVDQRSAEFDECDISFAVRVKEDLEVVRLLLANSAMAILSVLTVLLPMVLVGLLLLAYQRAGNDDGLQWVSLLPVAIFFLLVPVLIALASYQIGLWHFMSVRASGMLLFVAASTMLAVHVAEPFNELYVGFQGYSHTAWIYTGFLWLFSIPGFAVIASALGMSLRFARFSPQWDPVVRGWRAWPTHFWAVTSRSLCLPSFLSALPHDRFKPTLLFAFVVVLLALRTALVLGALISAPTILTSSVSAELTGTQESVNREPTPSVGAAITSRSAADWRVLLTTEKVLVAVPFFLVSGILIAGVTLNQRLAARCMRFAQRHAAGIYQKITQHDTRAPILFLRSFKEEKRLFEPPERSLLAKVLRLRELKRTLDEIVLDAASPVGPVVALGVPAEDVAPLGAARLYADDAEWQDTVRRLVQQSQAVIICIEEGDGVLWELKHLLADTHAAKTLCILSPSTSSATVRRAIAESRDSANVAVCDRLEQIQTHGSRVQTGKHLAGVWFPKGIVTPIFAENTSDYTHWCMVNLILAALTSG